MTTAALAPRLRPSRTAPRARRRPPALADRVIVEVATARDVRSGVAALIALLRRSGLERAEWWAPADGGRALRLELAEGDGRGTRTDVALGPVGVLVLVGSPSPQLLSSVRRVVPVLRRRWTDEQLEEHVALLVRQNAALEDFAGLVAHELKSTLYTALRQADPTSGVKGALTLVDSILEIARTESVPGSSAAAARCLEEALHDLGPIEADVVADLPTTFPLPPGALRLLLRNLIGNAVAAGARRILVSAVSTAGRWNLHVDDDGVGLNAPTGYASGSGLGLNLCQHLVARFGGVLELKPRPCGGTRALLVLAGGGS